MTEPYRNHYTDDLKFYSSELHLSYMQHHSRAAPEHSSRPARAQGSSRSAKDTLYARSFETQPRRHSELILPSVEREPRSEAQQSFNDAHPQQHNPFALGESINRGMPADSASSQAHLRTHEGPPQHKKRRIDDQQIDDYHGRERVIFMPLQTSEGYQKTRERPTEAVYDQSTRPVTLNNRIVQLLPRDATRYAGSQGRVQMIDRYEVGEGQLSHRAPRKHVQVPPLSPSASRQPQSLLSSNLLQSVYDHESPTLLKASKNAPLYREVHDQSPFSRHTSGSAVVDASKATDSYAALARPRRFDNTGKEMRSEFRGMTIEDQQFREHKPGMRQGPEAGHAKHAPLQNAQPKTHVSPRSHAEVHLRNSEASRDRIVMDKPLQSRNVQPQPVFYDRLYRPANQHFGNSGHQIKADDELQRTDPFDRRPTQPVRRPAEDQWLDL